MNKRQLSALETQNKIKSTVKDMMGTVPFDKITIRDICKVVGVSVGTFYLYFKSKDEALLYSHRYVDERFTDYDFKGEEDPVNKLIMIVRTYFETIREEALDYIQQIYIAHIKCDCEDMFSSDRVLAGLLIQVIDEGKEQGLINSETDSNRIAQGIMRNARSHVYDYCINPAKADQEAWISEAMAEISAFIPFYIRSF